MLLEFKTLREGDPKDILMVPPANNNYCLLYKDLA